MPYDSNGTWVDQEGTTMLDAIGQGAVQGVRDFFQDPGSAIDQAANDFDNAAAASGASGASKDGGDSCSIM